MSRSVQELDALHDEAHRLIAEINQYFNDVAHWNSAHPGEEINPDPDDKLKATKEWGGRICQCIWQGWSAMSASVPLPSHIRPISQSMGRPYKSTIRPIVPLHAGFFSRARTRAHVNLLFSMGRSGRMGRP